MLFLRVLLLLCVPWVHVDSTQVGNGGATQTPVPVENVCPECAGTGSVLSDCSRCEGSGQAHCRACWRRGLIGEPVARQLAAEAANDPECGAESVRQYRETAAVLGDSLSKLGVFGFEGAEGVVGCPAKCSDGHPLLRGDLECTVCGGKGSASCIMCKGKGSTRCPGCAGKRRRVETCDACFGSGTAARSAGAERAGVLVCPWCAGTQSQACDACADGRTAPWTCRACDGDGRVVCPRCRGTRRDPCKTCSATGERLRGMLGGPTEPCPACKHRGYTTCKECERGRSACEPCGGKGRRADACGECGGAKQRRCPCCALGSGRAWEAEGSRLAREGDSARAVDYLRVAVARESHQAEIRPGFHPGGEREREAFARDLKAALRPLQQKLAAAEKAAGLQGADD